MVILPYFITHYAIHLSQCVIILAFLFSGILRFFLRLYQVENWTVTPPAARIAGGQPGESTAKVKITAATTVKVTFSPYKKVAFEKLDDYLKTANATEIMYIEVTGLTDMSSCFSDCTKLTSVTLKCNYPSSAADAFKDAFGDCDSLMANGIKVPADQLQTYKDNADMIRTTADRFIAE